MKKTFWQRLKEVGPGAVVAAAFIGPGTVTSCFTSGASYGMTLLWAILFSTISVIIMQSMASRLGIVTQKGLGEALREKYTSTGDRKRPRLHSSHPKPARSPAAAREKEGT